MVSIKRNDLSLRGDGSAWFERSRFGRGGKADPAAFERGCRERRRPRAVVPDAVVPDANYRMSTAQIAPMMKNGPNGT